MARNDLTPEDWQDEINLGLKFRRDYGSEDQWAKLWSLYYNRDKSALLAGPNIIAANGDSMLSDLSVPNPHIMVKALRMDSLMGAKILERIDNNLLCQIKVRAEVERALLHTYIWGKGLLKVGYDSEWGYDPQFDIGGQANPMGATLSQFDKQLNRIEYDSDIKPGMPWVRSLMPHDFVVPFGTVDLRDAQWAVHRCIRHIDAIKADPKYENKRDLHPCMSRQDYLRTYQATLKPYRLGTDTVRDLGPFGDRDTETSEYVELWEIHDKRTRRVLVLATGHPKFLRNEVDLLQKNGLPFVDLSFVPRTHTFWTTSDAEYLRTHQADLSDIRMMATAQRRISAVKLLYKRRAIKENELDKAMSARVGIGIAIDDEGTPLDEVIKVLQPGGNYLLYQEEENIRRNAREVVGQSANQAGEYDKSTRRTATEAMVVQRGADKRMSRREALVRDTYITLFEKINPIVFEQWKQPRIVEVLGPQGVTEWVAVTGPELAGSYSYEVKFSSEPDENPRSKLQEALTVFQVLSQNPYVNQQQLAKYVAQCFNGIEPELLLAGPPLGGGLGADMGGSQAGGQAQAAPAEGPPTDTGTGAASAPVGGRIGAGTY